MLLAAALALGIALGLALGGQLGRLGHVHLRFESVLLALLFVQLALPALRITGPWAKVAFSAWLATFVIMAAIAFANRRQAGMPLIAVGLLCNALVIGLNLGMPVDGGAARAIGATSTIAIPPGDFAHTLVGASTRLLLLADILPVPGPPGWRLLASPGDVMLAAGATVFLAVAMAPSTPGRLAQV